MTGLPLACFRRRPARTGVSLGTGNRLPFPLDGKVGEVIAGLGLMEVDCFRVGPVKSTP
jgi:hypothetical protein